MDIWKYIFIFLLIILSLEIIAVIQIPDGKFHAIACNVGQGDAELLIYGKIQILVDGGPDTKVLNCLGKYLPFWDRELELVILTHPDSDHFGGLTEVFKRYKVNNYLANPVKISKPEYGVLEKLVGSKGIGVIYPHEGQRLRLGLIYLDILAPLEQLSINNYQFSNDKEITDTQTNSYSIVSLVSFGKFKALLTGDMTPAVSDSLSVNQFVSSVEYIKIPHHGSKNGLTQNLLEKIVSGGLPRENSQQEPSTNSSGKATAKILGVISVGKNNYGHPSSEVLQMLDDLKIKYMRTDKVGDIEVITDGETWRIK